MPTVQLSDGSWLQDSSDIIDVFEAKHPERGVIPSQPTQRIVSALMEFHSDEWLPMLALHYRWNIPKNAEFAINEFGRYALPRCPRFLSRRLLKKTVNRLRGYLPILGVTKHTISGVERYTTELIRDLNVHFQEHEFLLGGRPCLGDFSLFGPLYSHLYRDIGTTHLFDEAPALVSWFDRLLNPNPNIGEFLADDKIPETLTPIYQRIIAEHIPFMNILIERINAWADENSEAKKLPKTLGDAPFSIGGVQGSRKLITFVQWKAQRVILNYHQLSTSEREAVDEWLTSLHSSSSSPFSVHIKHPLERRAFRPYLMNR